MTNPAFEQTVRAVAAGGLDKAGLAAVLAKYAKPDAPPRR